MLVVGTLKMILKILLYRKTKIRYIVDVIFDEGGVFGRLSKYAQDDCFVDYTTLP